MRKSKNPAANIYGVQKNTIENSFGDRGKSFDRGDLERNQTVQTKNDKNKKQKETSVVPDFNNLAVPSEDNPITLSPIEGDEDKWQEF